MTCRQSDIGKIRKTTKKKKKIVGYSGRQGKKMFQGGEGVLLSL